MGKVVVYLQPRRFRAALYAYIIALLLFVGWMAFNPSDFGALLGTLVFTVASAFIAMFSFSRDLGNSTREQVFTLKEGASLQVREAEHRAKEYVNALRESSDRQAHAFEVEIGKTVAKLDDLSLKLVALTEAITGLGASTMELEKARVSRAEETLHVEKERLAAQDELKKAELARAQADANEKDEIRKRLSPTLFLRIDELPYLLWMKDFWLFCRVTAPVEELNVSARPLLTGSGRAGNWMSQQIRQPGYEKGLAVIKLGDVGVRGYYDAAEVRVSILTKDFRKFRGQATLLFSQNEWVIASLEVGS